MISFVFLIILLLALIIISDVEIFGYRLGEFFLNRLGLQSYDQDRFEAQKAFFKGIEKFVEWYGEYKSLSNLQ